MTIAHSSNFLIQEPAKLSSHTANRKNPPSTSGFSITPTTLLALALAFLAVILTMTSAMPGFLARLTRPFTSAAKLGVASENGAGAPSVIPEGAHRATVAAGCFWGVEHIYRKHFDGKGLYDARVGYIGGDVKNPSYRAVCTGETGRTFHFLPVLSLART